MTYVVYHETLPPKLVDDEEYLDQLLTGEWFDGPQTTQKGNRDETERLLEGCPKRIESRSFGCDGNAGEVLRNSDVRKRVCQTDWVDQDRDTNKSSETTNEVIEIKVPPRRGRPPKIRD